ncbi:MAG TPA: penicillin-binding protein 2 [Nevskiaceae bacterium]|nr:penicillin-binding protein 2 [Nevskiaceae bacterium]
MSTFDNIKDLYEERLRFSRRAAIAAAIGVVMVVLLVLRLVQLQIWDHAYYSTRSDDNRMRVVPVAPVRGLIYDREGVLMAQNLPSFDLVITRDAVPHLKATIAQLRTILPITDDDVQRFRDRARSTPSYRPVPLLTDLNHQEVARFEVNRYAYPGVDIRAGLVRDYPLGPEVSHVIGYVGGITEQDLKRINPDDYAGLNQIGRAGVERSHENELRGTPGTKIVEANAVGRPLRELDYKPGANGDNLYLTIDTRLQAVAEKALAQFNGAAVAIDPRNGDVLALVSKPGYDPSLFVNGLTQANYEAMLKDPNKPLYDRALQGLFSPGSTIKPFMAFAGLQAGSLTNRTTYFCPGYFMLPGSSRRFRCWKRSGHGTLDLAQAIEQSCDVFFYNVAYQLGIQRIDKYLAPFGFGRRTGIDLPGELPGLLPSPAWVRAHRHHVWYPGETLNTGIGQGIWKVTPLQLAEATARIAMHGVGFVPHIVYAVSNPATGRMVAVRPTPLPTIPEVHPNEWNDVIKGMEMVAQNPRGTAYRVARGAPYRIAAKTGTAQVIDMSQTEGSNMSQTGVALKYRDNALFIAFAPVDDPKIAVAIVAEHGTEGSSAAAPVAREMMDQYLLGHVLYGQKPATQRAAKPADTAVARRTIGVPNKLEHKIHE